jgi:NAD+ synthase (glutamine-hydrolysing)
MMKTCRIAMVQMNPIVGDLTGNVRAMTRWLKAARQAQADIVVFPELVITGYPPEDLVLRHSFLQDTRQALDQIVKQCRQLTAVVGFVEEGKARSLKSKTPLVVPSGPRHIFNSAAVIQDRQVIATCHKTLLPDYGVFDESRYFESGRETLVCGIGGIRVGVNICEDIWYADGPTRDQVSRGHAELIVNINASPFQKGKSVVRERMLSQRARENGVMVSYTNMVGGQDEIVFDGNSVLVDPKGKIIARAKAFEEDLLIADLQFVAKAPARVVGNKNTKKQKPVLFPIKNVVAKGHFGSLAKTHIVRKTPSTLNPLEEVYLALVTGVRDYVRKNGFSSVVIGISGGIDSALTAVIAADAIGQDNVIGVFMPSKFTSKESRDDSRVLMKALKCQLLTIPIAEMWKSYLKLLAPAFEQCPHDATEENLQARIRGTILMALSNKFGHLVLTTGNKSEMSVGYATLYGDMVGGFAVIKDVPKMLVYELARYRNRLSVDQHENAVIPLRIIERAPSAELKPDQTDQDTLPPYDVLDRILEAYVEEDCSLEEIVKLGIKSKVVRQVMAMVDRSEYKRRQAPIGIKITPRALGKDRRMPLTNRYLKH